MTTPALTETSLPGVPLHCRGKVRDVYDLDPYLLIVATDRISAYDHVLSPGIPDKGRVLTGLSAFWFHQLDTVVTHHLISTNPDDFPVRFGDEHAWLRGRSMLVRRTHPVPIECVARGYLAGSGWRDYLETGQVCGVRLPAGLRENDRLAEPIFTPATKAASGHDLNITEAEAADLVESSLLDTLKRLTLHLYAQGAAYAGSRGIIVADTKFEFGLLDERDPASLMLIDEVLTPDSSRFWPADEYAPGAPQPSFDKQFVRDYLDRIGWDHQPPVPTLSDEVVARTREKYLEAFERLTGGRLDQGPGRE